MAYYTNKTSLQLSSVGQNRIYTPYMTVYGDFPAKNTVYTPYIYGFGQTYK
jgi:hypothetical protein